MTSSEVLEAFKFNLQQKISSKSFFIFPSNTDGVAEGTKPAVLDSLFMLFRHFFNRIFPVFRVEGSLLTGSACTGDILFFHSSKESPSSFNVTGPSFFNATGPSSSATAENVTAAAFKWALGRIFGPRSQPVAVTQIIAQIIFTESLIKYYVEKIVLVMIDGNMADNMPVSNSLQSFAKDSKIMCSDGDTRYCNFLFAAVDYQKFGIHLDEAFGKTNAATLPRTVVLKYIEDHAIAYDILQLGGQSFFNASLSLLGNIMGEIDGGILEVRTRCGNIFNLGFLGKELQIQKYHLRIFQRRRCAFSPSAKL